MANPQSWPPDRNFKRDPSSQQHESLSTIDRIVRYAEKDDFLLYATALFGIIMPGIMYFVYKAAHAKYQVYAKSKREEKQREKAKKREITFFYMNTGNHLKRLAFSLAEQLEGFEPLVVPLLPNNLNILFNYKGTAFFVIPDSEPSSLSDESSWFFDWLQEMRFEAKEKNLLCTLSYAVFSVTELEQENIIGKLGNTLIKRLNALDAKELQPMTFIWNNKDTDMEIQLEHQGALLCNSMKESWHDYNSDDTDLMSAEDTMSESEPETDSKKTK